MHADRNTFAQQRRGEHRASARPRRMRSSFGKLVVDLRGQVMDMNRLPIDNRATRVGHG